MSSNILEFFSTAQGSISQHVLHGPFASRSPVVLIKMQIFNFSPNLERWSEFSSDNSAFRNLKTAALGWQRLWSSFCEWAQEARGSICSGKSRTSGRRGLRTGFLILCYIHRLCCFFVALFAISRILFGSCHFVYWDLALLNLKITFTF